MSETRTHPSSARERSGALPGGRSVPWLTVLSLAAVMAYGDGFWMMVLRGAVGAIERTQSPFSGWVVESTVALPVFVVAVLGALILALRWFGPVLRAGTFAATALMVVVAGTLVGVGQVALNAVYDYHLESIQLQFMHVTHHANSKTLLSLQQEATLGLQFRAVGYGVAILLVTNLVLVALAIAFRGGRLDVSVPGAGSAGRSRVRDLRLLLAAGFIGAAAIHAALVPQRLDEWVVAGVFFIVLAAVELAVAALLVARRDPRDPTVLLVGAVVSIGSLALWMYSHTIGLPFGPRAGIAEQFGLADVAACLLAAGTLLVAVVLLRGRAWLRRAPVSAHLRWLALVAVIAITTIGLGGTHLALT